ncbi:MAG: ABC transporter substrate-binding protein [Azospirillum sp.]|nr:ABC transporter substrate-binding protein [Azospirillum sp.]MCZ8123632.1 ABC transporter substrate-binding protein [Magnetospirillum sp.]
MKTTKLGRRGVIAGGLALAGAAKLAAPALAQGQTRLTFYYPVAVGGPITRLIDTMCADFERENPSIKVTPVYTGSYQDTIAKTLTALKSNEFPHFAILLSTDMFTLIDEDAIVPFDDSDRAWIGGFYPAFMENSQSGGKTWGIPFQRSTIVLYWNKEMFREAGLDPNVAPSNWAEQLAFAQRLTKRDASGNTAQWGMQIPSSGFPYWLFQGLTTQNDVRLMNPEGTRTFFDDPKVAEALQYWMDLAGRHRVHPPGIVEWGTTPRDFFERKVAMMWTTTGNLTNVRANARFEFGVSMLPAGRRRGSPTGGGNFYVFKKASAAERAAATAFAKFVTQPDRAAQWGIDTGYVAVTPAAFETQRMKDYVAGFPAAAVARDQLPHAWAELSTHDNQRVTKALNDGLQAALTGAKPAAAAMADAQREAQRLLRPFQRG